MEFAYKIFVFAFQVQFYGVHMCVRCQHLIGTARTVVEPSCPHKFKQKNDILHVLMKHMRSQLWELRSSRICKPRPICGEEFMGNQIQHKYTHILCLLWPFWFRTHESFVIAMQSPLFRTLTTRRNLYSLRKYLCQFQSEFKCNKYSLDGFVTHNLRMRYINVPDEPFSWPILSCLKLYNINWFEFNSYLFACVPAKCDTL